MIDSDKITICTPSYRRADGVKTLDVFPETRVYVDEGEADDYRKQNANAEIVVCPKGVQGNVARVRNYILDTEFRNGADAVLIVDDDITGFGAFTTENNAGKHVLRYNRVDGDFMRAAIFKYSILAEDLGAKLWGILPLPDTLAFSDEFSTKCFVGGPFQCFLRGGRCRYDERLPLKEDYDMTLQQLNEERIVLRVNHLYYYAKQSEQIGGCAAMRNREREREQLLALQRKWGPSIVKFDNSHRKHARREKPEDYNPVISVPIGGV